jgi:dipeptidyl aminopeptidase/acylaminoacyl peptidase
VSEDLRTDLHRASRHYAPPSDAWQRLQRKQERDQSRRRRMALVVGLGVAALSVGLVWFALHPGHRPSPGSLPEGSPLPANGELLYAKKMAAGWNLFAVNPTTGVERQITDGLRDYGSDWSPDGTRIVYDSESGSAYDIVVANADGSHPVVIGTGEDPAWSPDGTRIAYAGPGGSIWVMNADGTEAHAVTEGAAAGSGTGDAAAHDYHPAWSPDGSSIAYVRIAAHRWAPVPGGQMRTDVKLEEVRVWHEGTASTDTSLTDAYTGLGELDWSPDGSTIVFTGAPTLFYKAETDGLAWPRVLLIPSGGGAVAPISPAQDTWSEGATWSPDGRWIAYVDNNFTLVVMRPDGTDRRIIPIDPGDDEIIGPSWGVAPPSSP